MHWMPNEPKMPKGPETSGQILHWAPHYDFFSTVFGMGVNRSNSRMVIELARIKPGDSVLDVACGTGALTFTAQTYAGPSGKVYGIDASPEMIEFAKNKAERMHSPVTFQIGLAEKLDFSDSIFDAVISRLAIHHLPDDLKRRAFAEILRVLKPGGRLLIADFVPPANPFLRHVTSAVVGGHMMQTDVWSLPAMLSEAGFAEVSSGPTRSVFLAAVSGIKPTS